MPYLFLVPALLLAVLSSLRLCRLAAATEQQSGVAAPSISSDRRARDLPAPVDAAYLAGGPDRVVDLALVDMARRGLLHLAHTGWTSAARPHPGTELESEVFAALGPDGQRRTDEVRAAVAGGPSILALAHRLADGGLAVRPGARAALAQAVSGVRFSLLATVALGTAALGEAAARNVLADGHESISTPAAWFTLPLILSTGTLLMARAEFYPVTPWAAPAGQDLLRALCPRPRTARRLTDPLLTLILRGPSGLRDPWLRSALTVTPRKR